MPHSFHAEEALVLDPLPPSEPSVPTLGYGDVAILHKRQFSYYVSYFYRNLETNTINNLFHSVHGC